MKSVPLNYLSTASTLSLTYSNKYFLFNKPIGNSLLNIYS